MAIVGGLHVRCELEGLEQLEQWQRAAAELCPAPWRMAEAIMELPRGLNATRVIFDEPHAWRDLEISRTALRHGVSFNEAREVFRVLPPPLWCEYADRVFQTAAATNRCPAEVAGGVALLVKAGYRHGS